MRLLTKIIDSKKETQSSYAISKSASSKVLFSTPSSGSSSSAFSLQKSFSSSEIDDKRGFKPSDRSDPAKRKFLQNLTQKVFKVGLVSPPKFCHFHIPVPLHFPKDMMFFFLPRFLFHFISVCRNIPKLSHRVMFLGGQVCFQHLSRKAEKHVWFEVTPGALPGNFYSNASLVFQDENAPPPRPINLEKIFTPADGEQIQPKNPRKCDDFIMNDFNKEYF